MSASPSPSPSPSSPPPPKERTWLREHSELGVCALLLVAGLLVLVDSLLGTDAGSDSDPLGPHAVPFVLGVLLLVLAVLLAVDVLRGGHGEAEGGEDIDLTAPADMRTVAMLAGVLIATAVLIPILGWPLAGMVLFWGATYTLGSRALPPRPADRGRRVAARLDRVRPAARRRPSRWAADGGVLRWTSARPCPHWRTASPTP